MRDKDFKTLKHPIGSNSIASSGTEVAIGYRPDITVNDSKGMLQFILESEQKTDRKAFLGDLLKAEMYSEQQNARPELIIVMQQFSNTTTQQISDHLRPYMQWLAQKKNGNLNLSAIQILSDVDYRQAIGQREILGSPAFKKRGHVL